MRTRSTCTGSVAALAGLLLACMLAMPAVGAGIAPYEVMLAKLGSRHCLNLRPQARTCREGVLGRFLDEPRDYLIGVCDGQGSSFLPFARGVRVARQVAQEITPTAVVYHTDFDHAGLLATVSITAPFYPGDVELSTAPFFMVELHLENRGRAPRELTLELLRGDRKGEQVSPITGQGLAGPFGTWREQGVGCQEALATAAGEPVTVVCSEPVPGLPRERRFSGLRWRCRLEAGRLLVRQAVLSAYTADDVLQIRGQGYHFRYADLFRDARQVAVWALAEVERIRRRNDLFCATITASSLSPAARNLASYGVQSWMANTWWVSRSAPRSDLPREWFSIWEGCCRYHSTVDVVYNDSLFLLQYWPELLEWQFGQWELFRREGGWIPHDVGRGRRIAGQAYPHDMPVEEATNYLLLLHRYWRQTGRLAQTRAHARVAAELVALVAGSDRNGNGLPDVGTANTVDQGSRVIQHAPDQLYLGIKALSAFLAAGELAAEWGEDKLALQCAQAAARIRETVDSRGWLGDHYAIALGGKQGRGYSIYTTNGLVHLLMAGAQPPLPRERLALDLRRAAARTMGEYGSTHSDGERNLWISQNVWRDLAGAYLGVNREAEAARYWDFERGVNWARGGCFTDSYTYPQALTGRWAWNPLNYYPRGAAAVGFVPASARLTVDAAAREVRFDPFRLPARVPLTSLADWEAEAVPWLQVEESGAYTISQPELLAGWRVTTRRGER